MTRPEAESLNCPHGLPRSICIACARSSTCTHGMPVGRCLSCKSASFGMLWDFTSSGAGEADDDPLIVPKGQLTFDVEGTEGGKYHSRKAHWPGGASGVTIGRGYDMKERTKNSIIADLTAAGIPKSEATLLAEGAGKTDSNASNFITKNEVAKIEITKAAQKALFSGVYEAYVATVKRISDKEDAVDKYGRVDWDKLHPVILDIAVDLTYRGDYTTLTRKSVQPHIVNNDLQKLYDVLSDEDKMVNTWGVPQERFEKRKSYLKAALDAEKAQGN
jgi:hypothetical protein